MVRRSPRVCHSPARSAAAGAFFGAALSACGEKLGTEDWADHVLQEATLRWIDEAEKRFPALQGDPVARYERLRGELAAALVEKRRAVAKEVAAAVRHRQTNPTFPPGAEVHPNRKAGTDWNRLGYELGKKRRIKPLRALMRELPWPLARVLQVERRGDDEHLVQAPVLGAGENHPRDARVHRTRWGLP